MRSAVDVVFHVRLYVGLVADRLLRHDLHAAVIFQDLDLAVSHFFHHDLHVGANHPDHHLVGAVGVAASIGPAKAFCLSTGWTVHCDDSVSRVHAGR